MSVVRACLHHRRLKLRELMWKTYAWGDSVVNAVAEQGDIAFFRVVVTCMEESSTREQVLVNTPLRRV